MFGTEILIGAKVKVLQSSGVVLSPCVGFITDVQHVQDNKKLPLCFFVEGKSINQGAGAFLLLDDIIFLPQID
jgi:hypothetical protein